jgi:hypothetical protein
LSLGFAAQRYEASLKEALVTHLKEMPNIGEVTLSIETKNFSTRCTKKFKTPPKCQKYYRRRIRKRRRW